MNVYEVVQRAVCQKDLVVANSMEEVEKAFAERKLGEIFSIRTVKENVLILGEKVKGIFVPYGFTLVEECPNVKKI